MSMSEQPPVLEMTVEGEFVGPVPGAKPPFGTRLMIWVAVFAGIAVSCAVGLFALWLLAFLAPVALAAALIAYAAFRYQVWRAGGSFKGGTIRVKRRR
jgi:hypothetical protein